MKLNESEDYGETRRTIIQTAHRLFMESGYRAVSTRQIADACGLTQPALYHHFKNKQTLYIEVILSEIQKTKTALERIIKRYDDLKDRLVEVAHYILLNKPEDMNQMFRDIQHELPADSRKLISDNWFEGFIQPISHIFMNGIQSGKLRKPDEFGTDPIRLAFLFLNMLSHSPIESTTASPQDQKKIYEKHVDMMVNVLLFGVASHSKKI